MLSSVARLRLANAALSAQPSSMGGLSRAFSALEAGSGSGPAAQQVRISTTSSCAANGSETARGSGRKAGDATTTSTNNEKLRKPAEGAGRNAFPGKSPSVAEVSGQAGSGKLTQAAAMALPDHVPVMVSEVIHALVPETLSGSDGKAPPPRFYLDGTVGLAGHAAALLLADPFARVVGLDRDPSTALDAQRRIDDALGSVLGGSACIFDATRGTFRPPVAACTRALLLPGVSFADRAQWDAALQAANWAPALSRSGGFHGVLLDLGVGSHQVEAPSALPAPAVGQAEAAADNRGFSYLREGPLDMRYSASVATADGALPDTAWGDASDGPLTAGDIVSLWPKKKLARLFTAYGGLEPARAWAIASAICQWRGREVRRRRIVSSMELRYVVEVDGCLLQDCPDLSHPLLKHHARARRVSNEALGQLDSAKATAARLRAGPGDPAAGGGPGGYDSDGPDRSDDAAALELATAADANDPSGATAAECAAERERRRAALMAEIDRQRAMQRLTNSAAVDKMSRWGSGHSPLGNRPRGGATERSKTIRWLLASKPMYPVEVRGVFQALRIAANDEFGELQRALALLPAILCKKDARLAFLVYQPDEDKAVQAALRTYATASPAGPLVAPLPMPADRFALIPESSATADPEALSSQGVELSEGTQPWTAVRTGKAEIKANRKARSARLLASRTVQPPEGSGAVDYAALAAAVSAAVSEVLPRFDATADYDLKARRRSSTTTTATSSATGSSNSRSSRSIDHTSSINTVRSTDRAAAPPRESGTAVASAWSLDVDESERDESTTYARRSQQSAPSARSRSTHNSNIDTNRPPQRRFFHSMVTARQHGSVIAAAEASMPPAAAPAAAAAAAAAASPAAIPSPRSGAHSFGGPSAVRRVRGVVIPDLLRTGASPVALPHPVLPVEALTSVNAPQRDPTFSLPLTVSAEQLLDKDAIMTTGMQRFKQALQWNGLPYNGGKSSAASPASGASGAQVNLAKEFGPMTFLNIAEAAGSVLDPVARAKLLSYAHKRALLMDTVDQPEGDDISPSARKLQEALSGTDITFTEAKVLVMTVRERLFALSSILARAEARAAAAESRNAEKSGAEKDEDGADLTIEDRILRLMNDKQVREAAFQSFHAEEKIRRKQEGVHREMRSIAAKPAALTPAERERLYALAADLVMKPFSEDDVHLVFHRSVKPARRGAFSDAVLSVLRDVTTGAGAQTDGGEDDTIVAQPGPDPLTKEQWQARRDRHMSRLLQAPIHDSTARNTVKAGEVASPWTEQARQRLSEGDTRAKLLAILRSKKEVVDQDRMAERTYETRVQDARRSVEGLLKFAMLRDSLEAAEQALEQKLATAADSAQKTAFIDQLASKRVEAALTTVKMKLAGSQ